jgi:hypothetical protein
MSVRVNSTPVKKPLRKVLNFEKRERFDEETFERSDWQCLHLVAPASIGSLQKGHLVMGLATVMS